MNAKPNAGRIGWIAAGAAGVLAFGAVTAAVAGSAVADENPDEVAVQDESETDSGIQANLDPDDSDDGESGGVPPEAELTYHDAAQLALSEVGEGATVVEVDLDREDGRLIWEVKLVDSEGVQRELELDAQDGSVLKHETDDDSDDYDDGDDDDDSDDDYDD